LRSGCLKVRSKAFILAITLWLAPVSVGFALIGGEADDADLYAAVVLLSAGFQSTGGAGALL
jgi:hypothetical protein